MGDVPLVSEKLSQLRAKKSHSVDTIALFCNGDRGLALLDLLSDTASNLHVITPKKHSQTPLFREQLSSRSLAGIHQLDNVNSKSSIALLDNISADLHVVAGFSQIFRKTLLAVPRLGTINLHGGPLPHYRGGSPLNWQLINGEDAIGISCILMDSGIDTGPVLAEGFFPTSPDTTIRDVHAQANNLFPRLLKTAIENLLISGSAAGREQNDAKA